MPRSGHHYLARLLQEVLGEQLHYCEFYTPLDCCRQVPCRRAAAPVVYQKNHDFDLGLDPALPGCLYIVQYRSPLLEALSDRELLESVSPELAGDDDHLLVWLAGKAAYFRLFHAKWIARGAANRVLVPYERLLDRPLDVLREILERAGLPVDRQALDAAVHRHSDFRHGTARSDFKPRLRPPGTVLPLPFLAFEALLAGMYDSPKSPSSPRPAGIPDRDAADVMETLRLGTEACAATIAREPRAAAAAWGMFCDRHQGTPSDSSSRRTLWRHSERSARRCAGR